LKRDDLLSTEPYRLSIRSIISGLIPNGNRPESLIRQGRRREKKKKKKMVLRGLKWIIVGNL
jgi:hypothetical protein